MILNKAIHLYYRLELRLALIGCLFSHFHNDHNQKHLETKAVMEENSKSVGWGAVNKKTF